MSIILKGPIKIEDVVNLIDNISRAYYDAIGHGGHMWTNFGWWRAEDIVYPSDWIPSDQDQRYDLQRMYHRAQKGKLLPTLAKNAAQFAVAINTYGRQNPCSKGWVFNQNRAELKTRVFDKTMLEDLVTGQTFPATTREFVIATYRMIRGDEYKSCRNNQGITNMNHLLWGFIEYRNKMVQQAQKRINARVTGAAERIITELL